MIAEILSKGVNNPKTGRELATMLGVTVRDIGIMVEQERRSGQPICASTNSFNAGYYLAENKEQLDDYISRLHHREKEIAKTRQALISIANQFKEAS